MTFRADLHCHTTCSDGSLTPVELVRLAKAVGLSGLAITDHDTIDAYQTAREEAEKQGILLGSGVEFSSVFKKVSVHILAYDFPINSSTIHTFCARHQERRIKRNLKILTKLTARKMPVTPEELLRLWPDAKTIGRPHIAKLMIEKGYVSSIKEAFNLYIGDGKSCFDEGEAFSSEETLSIIHEAGGKAFLAHPHLLDRSDIVNELLKLPFDGIECHYGKFTPDIEKRWVKLAEKKGLLISGGSDFHGDDKQYLALGSSWVNEESFHKIFQRRA
ncbi:MAG: PHP domain-containing protein [Chlamydiales bacterium]|nr:PHP domain-containing protein [Chlamydiales bacterium]